VKEINRNNKRNARKKKGAKMKASSNKSKKKEFKCVGYSCVWNVPFSSSRKRERDE
jgi:hypothetical protein